MVGYDSGDGGVGVDGVGGEITQSGGDRSVSKGVSGAIFISGEV